GAAAGHGGSGADHYDGAGEWRLVSGGFQKERSGTVTKHQAPNTRHQNFKSPKANWLAAAQGLRAFWSLGVGASLVIGVCCLVFSAVHAADWPQWRGPNRDGHPAAGSAPIESLPKELKPVWKTAIGPGFSSPVVAKGK